MDVASRHPLHETDEADTCILQPTMTTRPHASERSHHSKRGHAPQISISDVNHHVTEAIGGMYGSDDEEYSSPSKLKDPRPLSFMGSPKEAYESSSNSYFDTKRSSPPRTPLGRTISNERMLPNNTQMSPKTLARTGSPGAENGPLSPPPLTRNSSSETAVQQFPLNDIDYESSPAAVAQELSNLQAIRRMSMNVDMADPDLPSFSTNFGIPAVAPPHSADEDDASRLFWVPARLHPELAPKEFKTFVEDRVVKMKRRSGDDGTLLPESVERSGSGGGLKRKKSMLSRQINEGRGYEDGAERLERKRSEGRPYEPSAVDSLSELENLVNDPSKLIRKMSIDSTRRSQDSGVEVPASDDMPILPPLGVGLKRSTRTAYRRGSLRKGERAPFSKRAMGRQADEAEDTTPASPALPLEEPKMGLTRVQTEPTPVVSTSAEPAENFSRPGRTKRSGLGTSTSSDNLKSQGKGRRSPPPAEGEKVPSDQPQPQPFHSRIASNGRTTAQLPGQNAPVPQIIETPPPADRAGVNSYVLPERKSSHKPPPPMAMPSAHSATRGGSQMQGAHGRQLSGAQRAPQVNSTLDDISSHPSPLPGSGNSRTDDLTMVPTFSDKKAEKKDSRKPSWHWLLGSEEKDREKERERDRDEKKEKEKEREKEKQREKEEKDKEALRKPKVSSKLARAPDKTRLDVLQTSIDGGGGRGRESIVLDRDTLKLEEERKKESTRKSSESTRKEKDGILSAIFGGGKKSKAADESSHKRRIPPNRGLSPEPPPRTMKPDIDYNWTRFSILEERAIYRMAHIKLANPKRALYSQVLLSNFMYSYLAKVQQMHPQMQIPGANKASQQRNQHKNGSQGVGASKKEEKQSEEFSQYQRWQEVR